MTNRKFLSCSVLSVLALVLLPQLSQALMPPPLRFSFKIDPKTPLKDLLPVPPMASPPAGPLITMDLAKVPEVNFQEPLRLVTKVAEHPVRDGELAKEETDEKTEQARAKLRAETPLTILQQIAHQIAKINFLNRNHPDRFMIYLVKDRTDLAGLPFVMGDACRMKNEQSRLFKDAVQKVRRGQRPRGNTKENQAAIAAMMQILGGDSYRRRLSLVSYLANLEEPAAIPALARLALFSEEKEIRSWALKLLENREDEEIKGFLFEGLNYPWPTVAENAGEAIVQLKRADLVPDLINILEQPDPRAPAIKEIKGKKVPVVRELVRINHHRNCLLCHPPGNTPDVSKDVLTAGVPIPGVSLFSAYRMQSPDVLVRADVTYLRQDFSRLQEVPDAHPWPRMQRFDFLVRTRMLTEVEAKKYQAEFAKVEKNSPYRQAALAALRALTGRDAEPTAAAWRKVLAQKKP